MQHIDTQSRWLLTGTKLLTVSGIITTPEMFGFAQLAFPTLLIIWSRAHDNPNPNLASSRLLQLLAFGMALQDRRAGQVVRMVMRMGSMVRMLAVPLHNGCLVLVEGEEVSLVFDDIDEFNRAVEYFIANNLVFEAETTSEYVGDMGDGGNLYEDSTTVRVLLRDKQIGAFDV